MRRTFEWTSFVDAITFTLVALDNTSHRYIPGQQTNALVGGAFAGAAISLIQGKASMDHIVRGAISGGAVAMAAEILINIEQHRR